MYFGIQDIGDVTIKEISGMAQAFSERIYCENGGKIEPTLEHLHYVCYLSNAIFMTLQGYSLFFDEFYIKDGLLYSPLLDDIWGTNRNVKLRKLQHRTGVTISGLPSELQTGVTRVVSRHIFSQDIEKVRHTIETSMPFINAMMKVDSPVRTEEEDEFGVRVSRRDMKKYMDEIRKECGSFERVGSDALRNAFMNSYSVNELEASNESVSISIQTMLGLPMDITDEEVENELKNMPKAINSGFNLGAYC